MAASCASRDPTDVVDCVRHVDVQVHQCPRSWVVDYNRASSCGPVFVELQNNRAQQAVVVFDGLGENRMQLDVRHSTAQRAVQVQYLRRYGGERFVDPLGEVGTVCGQGYVHCVLRCWLICFLLKVSVLADIGMDDIAVAMYLLT
jgi:hypothetical protein